MELFTSDLDNTLIFSAKRIAAEQKLCVEWYLGKELSFMSQLTYDSLNEVNDRLCFVPVTTRSIEQYQRICFNKAWAPQYALVCNGGILLIDNKIEENWYCDSLNMVRESRKELLKAVSFLDEDSFRNFEVRNIYDLFIFTKSACPERTEAALREKLDMGLCEVFRHESKIYVLPLKLNKGSAVTRLKEKLGAEKLIAAGDSKFDIPMLLEADIAFYPDTIEEEMKAKKKGKIAGTKEELFSETILKTILEFSER